MVIKVDDPWGYSYGYYADVVMVDEEVQSKVLDKSGRPMIYQKQSMGFNLKGKSE